MCRSLQVNSWYIWMFIPQVTISKQGTIGLDPSLSVGCLVMNLGPNSKTDLYCNILQQIQQNLKLAGEIDAGGYMGYWRILIHSAQWGAENTVWIRVLGWCTPAVQGYFQLVDRWQRIGNNSAMGQRCRTRAILFARSIEIMLDSVSRSFFCSIGLLWM